MNGNTTLMIRDRHPHHSHHMKAPTWCFCNTNAWLETGYLCLWKLCTPDCLQVYSSVFPTIIITILVEPSYLLLRLRYQDWWANIQSTIAAPILSCTVTTSQSSFESTNMIFLQCLITDHWSETIYLCLWKLCTSDCLCIHQHCWNHHHYPSWTVTSVISWWKLR